jgi:hypothetical protein
MSSARTRAAPSASRPSQHRPGQSLPTPSQASAAASHHARGGTALGRALGIGGTGRAGAAARSPPGRRRRPRSAFGASSGKPSAGQSLPAAPSRGFRHVVPAAPRHSAVLFGSSGHVAHVGAGLGGSQTPADPRHSVPAAANRRPGSRCSRRRVSATSQTPAAAALRRALGIRRTHTANPCGSRPSHPARAAHSVAADTGASGGTIVTHAAAGLCDVHTPRPPRVDSCALHPAGHAAFTARHVSATSQTPAAPRPRSGGERIRRAVVARAIAGLTPRRTRQRRATLGRARFASAGRGLRAGAALSARSPLRRRRGAGARRQERIRGATVACAVLGLGHVTNTARRPTFRSTLGVGRTRGCRSRAILGQIAHASRAATLGARRDERIGRAVIACTVTRLGHVADAGRRAAFRGALRIRGTRRT